MIQQQDDTQQVAELRLAFLRHLPKRLEMLRKRGQRLCDHGWDINALTLLFREVQTLAGASGRYGLLDIGEHLFSIESFLAPFVSQVSIPDAAQTAHFAGQLRAIAPLIARHSEQHGEADRAGMAAALTVATSENIGFPMQVTPPADYWKRFSPTTAGPPAIVPARAPTPPASVPPTQPVPATSVATIPAAIAKQQAPALEELHGEHTSAFERTEDCKVYHLSDGNTLACEVDQKLEAIGGYELTLLDNVDQLREILDAFPPHLVLVDAAFEGSLEGIGEMIRATRAKINHRLALLSFSTSAELPVRLRAMRAGADAFIALPAQTDDITQRIAELVAADNTNPYRVLIVEDDRAQAMFAESILRKAGMTTRMVTDPLAALDQLDEFQPELILMDLYMPTCDGMELTAIIREREAFISTPIVFLSGEHNQEKHFEALDSGGDDFLSKPIRPKHLISAVINRVRRARQLGRRSLAQNPRDAVTGLYQRAYVLDQVNALLTREDVAIADGGLLYVEIDGAMPIRERVGMLVFDALLNQVGAFIASRIDGRNLAARYGDTSLLLLSPQDDEAALKRMALDLRTSAARETFEQDGKTFSLSLSFGICPFAARLGEVGAMLNAAERVMVEARTPTGGHVGVFHAAPKNAPSGSQQALAEQIRAALKADNFQLLFQPIVALQGAAVEQFQALLRLRGSDGKLYTAAEIVPVAQREGLIADVDRWVLSRCLLVLAERARQQRSVRLFISQSIDSATDAQHIVWLKQMLETRRLDGEQLAIELRLGDMHTHLRAMIEFANALRELGVKIALSAFDASPAAFQLLEKLPVDFLKIGPRYGDTGLSNPAIREELKLIVKQAQESGKQVIAPRIENAQSAALLWTAGVDYIQGDFVQQAGDDLSFDFHAASAQ